jgi:hypothetical protein
MVMSSTPLTSKYEIYIIPTPQGFALFGENIAQSAAGVK